jgi:hypothetical protein
VQITDISDNSVIVAFLGDEEGNGVRVSDDDHGRVHKLVHMVSGEYHWPAGGDILLPQDFHGSKENGKN